MSTQWHKASYSGASGACVEAAQLAPHRVGLRDSQHPQDTILELPTHAWAALVGLTR